MLSVPCQDIVEITESLSRKLGDTLDPATIRPIGRPAGKENIKDATLAFFVDGHLSKDDIVLLVSNPTFPDAVAEDVERAAAVRALLDPGTGDHVMQPKSVGAYETRTYAAFSKLSPISDRRLLRFAQKRALAPKIISWVAGMARQTRAVPEGKAAFHRYFVAPLQLLVEDAGMSTDLRTFAGSCLDVVTSSEKPFFTVAEHGDFWVGNVLFDRMMIPGAGAILGEFFVIDWRGSRLDGYPCIDAIRFSRSIHAAGSARADILLQTYRSRLGIEAFEMGLYCMLSLGRLGMNLEYFPRERYLSLCRDMFRFLEAHRLTGTG